MPVIEEVIGALVSIIVEAVGHEKALQLVSEEAQRRANVAADAVAAARIVAEKTAPSF